MGHSLQTDAIITAPITTTSKLMGEAVVDQVLEETVKEDITVTGGVPENIGVVKFMEESLGEVKSLPEDPQLMGAIGTAVIAREKAEKQKMRVQI